MTATTDETAHPALPRSLWPTPDQAAWAAATQPTAFLATGSGGADWRPATRLSAERCYGRWLGWLLAREPEAAISAPGMRLSEKRLRAYLGFLQQGRSSVTVASTLGVLYMTLVAMFPEQDWTILRAVQSRLRLQASPSRNKRTRLVSAVELRRLGQDLLKAGESDIDWAGDHDPSASTTVAAARTSRRLGHKPSDSAPVAGEESTRDPNRHSPAPQGAGMDPRLRGRRDERPPSPQRALAPRPSRTPGGLPGKNSAGAPRVERPSRRSEAAAHPGCNALARAGRDATDPGWAHENHASPHRAAVRPYR